MSGDLAKALVAAQAEMPAVEPDAVNPHFKSKFVSLGHLIAKTRPVLNKHGLCIIQAPSMYEGEPALKTTIYHESGESDVSLMPLLLGGADMQKLGAAITYARRFAWAAALGISDQDDDDGNQASAPSDGAAKPAGAAAGGASTQPEAGATSSAPASGSPDTASQNGADEHFRFISGAHKGKTLAEAPRSYIEWCVANHPKDDVREMCALFLGFEATVAAADEDIPF